MIVAEVTREQVEETYRLMLERHEFERELFEDEFADYLELETA